MRRLGGGARLAARMEWKALSKGWPLVCGGDRNSRRKSVLRQRRLVERSQTTLGRHCHLRCRSWCWTPPHQRRRNLCPPTDTPGPHFNAHRRARKHLDVFWRFLAQAAPAGQRVCEQRRQAARTSLSPSGLVTQYHFAGSRSTNATCRHPAPLSPLSPLSSATGVRRTATSAGSMVTPG